ncbi:MAG: hypothetical protein ACK4MV_04560 [Beijerinckiaceae bacterium]
MQLVIEREEEPTSITGLSLVLFLFLSMISMMAAYEASKPVDDIRKTIVASFHEYAPSVAADTNDPADTNSADHAELVLPLITASYSRPPSGRLFHPRSTVAGFNARAPPGLAAAVF